MIGLDSLAKLIRISEMIEIPIIHLSRNDSNCTNQNDYGICLDNPSLKMIWRVKTNFETTRKDKLRSTELG